MSIKETLERFREKKLGQLDFCGNDDHECECTVKEEEIKQFITEEIKLAMEEIVPKYTQEIKNSGESRVSGAMYALEQGRKLAIDQVRSNISKYFEV